MVPVSGIVRAGGKAGLGRKVRKDSLGSLALKCAQVIRCKQGLRAWKRSEVGGVGSGLLSSWGKEGSHEQEGDPCENVDSGEKKPRTGPWRPQTWKGDRRRVG